MAARTRHEPEDRREQGVRQGSGKEDDMFIKAILSVIATLGIMVWLFIRRHAHHPTITRQDSEAIGDPGGNADELDDAHATEIVATWNLLNPP